MPRTAPGWRRQPYRVLFPVGAALAVVAVLPFPLRGAGGGALGLFHSVAQILGFLTCFVVALLFTYVPRLTHTVGPEGWEMAVAVAVPPASVALAWGNAGETPYVLWLGLVAVAFGFTATRLRAAAARGAAPQLLAWVPASLAAGAVGAVLTAVSPLLAGGGAPRPWVIGRGLLVQGLVAGLVLGMGELVVRPLTRGEEAPRDAGAAGRRRALGAHALAAAAFFASFPLEVLVHARLGLALRAAVATGVLVAARLHRPPTRPGLQRRLAWIGTWLVPLGFWIAALFPHHRGAALHVVFVGGFSQLAFALATHVALHDGAPPERARPSRPHAQRLMSALLVAAFAARILAGVDLAHVAGWLSVAGAAFTAAVAAWAVVVIPALVRGPGPATGREARGPDRSRDRGLG